MRLLISRYLTVFFMVLIFSLSAGGEEEKKPQYSVYKNIIEKKVIRIGISRHYPPLNFNSGKSGLEIEMAKNLGDFLGVSVEFVPLTVAEYIPSIIENRVDIVIAGLSRNLMRAKKIWYSSAYLTVTPGVLASKRILPQTRFGEWFEQSPIRTVWDLKRLTSFKFAVKRGSSYEVLLANKFPDMPRVFVNTNEEGLELLSRGIVHGFIHDSLYLQYIYSKTGKFRGSFKLLQGGRQIEMICVGLPFGDVTLKNQVDVFISELIREGQIKEWLKKYNK